MMRLNATVAITVVSLSLLLFSGCVDEGNNTEVSRTESPDGKRAAAMFVRDVGATADFSTQVSLLDLNASLGNDKGNIFICDSNHGRASLLENHSYWLNVTWLSPTELVIQYDKNVRIFKKIEKYGVIHISYEPVSPPIGTK
jgi:hypothetical protein